MKLTLMTLLFVVVVVEPAAIAPEKANSPTTETGLGRWVRVEATVKAPVVEVWRVFTTSEGAEEFFAQKANIRLAIGGPYEIQFDPKNEQSGTKGLKILSYAPEEMILFSGMHRQNIPRCAMVEPGLSFKCGPKGQIGRT